MNESLITIRYAKAIFSVASENDSLLELKNDMELVLDACNGSPDLIHMLNSPVVVQSVKINVLKEIFAQKISDTTLQLLILTIKNGREAFIPAICKDVVDMIKAEKNIVDAVITTARELDEETIEKARQTLEKELNARVELTAKINERIIGGMVLRIDNMQYDASVETRLKKLKKELLETQL